MNIEIVINNNQDGSQSIRILEAQTKKMLSSLNVPFYWALGDADISEDGTRALFATGENEVLVVNLEDPYHPSIEIWQRKNQQEKEEWLEF